MGYRFKERDFDTRARGPQKEYRRIGILRQEDTANNTRKAVDLLIQEKGDTDRGG